MKSVTAAALSHPPRAQRWPDAAQRWLASQQPEYDSFIAACGDPRAAQERKLLELTAANAESAFGVRYRFSAIRSYRDFCDEVPLHTWDEIWPWIERIAGGELTALTSAPVTGFEETSGSTAGARLIPYTPALKAEFEQAVAAWMVALSRQVPEAFSGNAYWSLSPPLKPRQITRTAAGLPIGMDNDLAYFSAENARDLAQMIVVPLVRARHADARHFYRDTLLHLLDCRDLSMISVWSPSFFLQLDQVLRTDPACTERLQVLGIRAGARREPVWTDIWPRLALMSCWTDAQSAFWIPRLKARLGDALIQGKGLLATEGVTTIPFVAGHDPVPALRSHFFEFRPISNGPICRVHELARGREYEVILTTSGGLYRYCTGDVVRVTDILVHDLPCLKFIGRSSRQSDLVGEKLNERHVHDALDRAFAAGGTAPCEAVFLYPILQEDGRFAYVLFAESAAGRSDVLAAAVTHLESLLERNPYYSQAIALGQLRPVIPRALPAGFMSELAGRLARRLGVRDGDLKMPALFLADELDGLLPEEEF